MIKIKVFILFAVLSLSQSKNSFMPNLPLGEYRMVFSKIYQCGSTKDLPLKFNVYFSKKTLNVTEMKGNITTSIQLDNNLLLDINFSSWSSTGGWLPNAYVYITKKACSETKNLLGNAWYALLKGFNIPTVSCPIPARNMITIDGSIQCSDDEDCGPAGPN
ncbi:hypothetical protein QTP88_027997 [Uroleucon formosanum]